MRADGEVRFQLVYTAEAHASDEWPVGSHIAQRQPRSTHERVSVARRRLAELGVNWPGTLVDTGREAFQEAFACWPLRWYFLDGHTITHIAQPSGGAYDVTQIELWINLQLERATNA